MSSDLIETGSARDHRFGRTLIVTVLCLVVLAAGLTVLNMTRSPQLESADIDVTAAVTQSGPQLVLRFDQPVRGVTPAAVTVNPAVPFEVAADGTDLTLTFEEMLQYATSYDVAVSVRSATGTPATRTFGFTTPPAQFYALQRAGTNAPAGSDDTIVRRVVGAGSESEGEPVYRSPRIQEFAVAEPAIAVATSDRDGVGELTLAAVDSTVQPLVLLERVSINQLRSSGPGGIIGFTAVREDGGDDPQPNQLMILDPASSAPPFPVLGVDGKPLTVSSWNFVPGTRSLVAQTPDSAVYLIDPAGRTPPRPLGTHTSIRGFLPGTTTVVVEDAETNTAIDLATGKSRPLPRRAPPAGNELLQLLPLTDDDQVRLIGRYTDEIPNFVLDRASEGRTQVLYRPPDPTTWLPTACLSPNGQLVALESVPYGAAVDDYGGLPGYTPTTILILDIRNATVVDRIPGFLTSWCS